MSSLPCLHGGADNDAVLVCDGGDYDHDRIHGRDHDGGDELDNYDDDGDYDGHDGDDVHGLKCFLL